MRQDSITDHPSHPGPHHPDPGSIGNSPTGPTHSCAERRPGRPPSLPAVPDLDSADSADPPGPDLDAGREGTPDVKGRTLPRPRVPSPARVVPLRAFLLVLFLVPRVVIPAWIVIQPASWDDQQSWGGFPTFAWWLFLPFTALAAVIMQVDGTVDAVDRIVLFLAVASDLLAWITVYFEYRHGSDSRHRTFRGGSVGERAGRGPGNADDRARPVGPSRVAARDWTRLAAMLLPWPGMRLQATRRRWPADKDLDPSDLQLLRFMSYDSTLGSILFSTPAWLAAIFALAVVNNLSFGWQVRLPVAILGPLLTLALIEIVGARNAQFRVVYPLVRALRVLYNTPQQPLTTREVRTVNRLVSRAADAVQRLPVRLHSTNPTAVGGAARKSAALVALQQKVMSGDQAEVLELEEQLRKDLVDVLHGRWRDLPELPADERVRGLTRWQKAGFVAVAAALIVAAVLVGTLADQWNAATGPAIAALIGTAMAALVRAGIAPGGLQQAIDLGKDAIDLSNRAGRS